MRLGWRHATPGAATLEPDSAANHPFEFVGLKLPALDVPAAGRKFVPELTVEQQRKLANGIERVIARCPAAKPARIEP